MDDYQFRDFLGWIFNPENQGAAGKVKYDQSGNLIPKDERRRPNQIKFNPYNINRGNAINPNVTFADEIMAKANKPFAQGSDLTNIYNQARGGM
jgi:hypothetical protein